MTQIATTTDAEVERVRRRLEEMRRSFDDDIRSAPREDTARGERFLLLTLSSEGYAFPVAHALEIIPAPTIVPVPGVPPAVLGIINFRGQILSVTTVHGVLGLGAGERGPSGWIIVTKGLPLTTGIVADGVAGIAEVALDAIQPVPTTIGDDTACLLAGQVYVEQRLISILNVEQLCASGALCMSRIGPMG